MGEVKFSKNGIIKFIEDLLELESPDNKKNTKNAKLWENKLQMSGIKMYLKKGGSQASDSQPFIRTEAVFNAKYKMNKLADMVSQLSTFVIIYLFLTDFQGCALN